MLNVSSVASFQPAPGLAVYAATKAYVTSLSESLHEEVKDHGVHVTALCPGLTKTEFQSVSNTEDYATEFPAIAWTSPEQVVDEALAVRLVQDRPLELDECDVALTSNSAFGGANAAVVLRRIGGPQ